MAQVYDYGHGYDAAPSSAMYPPGAMAMAYTLDTDQPGSAHSRSFAQNHTGYEEPPPYSHSPPKSTTPMPMPMHMRDYRPEETWQGSQVDAWSVKGNQYSTLETQHTETQRDDAGRLVMP
jgi:hypothetical protein